MSNYVPGRQAAKLLGVCQNTLRLYADSGKINVIRTPSGQRRYDVTSFVRGNVEHRVVCYCRVSSPSQRDDLQRQISFMSERFPEAEIVKDVGSALNYKRKGLKSLLGRILRGEKLKIVVAHRDRLARFGFELIEWIVTELGNELVVLNDSIREPEQELTEDLLTIIHVFSCRLYGLRTYKSRKDKILAEQRTKETVEQLVGDLQVRLQRDSVVVESEDNLPELHGDQEIFNSAFSRGISLDYKLP